MSAIASTSETALHELTAQQQWLALQRSEISPRELVAHYIERIERLNPELGAFVTVTADAALTRADQVQQQMSRSAPLWGLPLADKDLVHRRGVPTGSGSRLMSGFVPGASDDLVLALDSAGAVSLGKTSTPEFGMTCYTESLVAPPTRLPYDLSRGAGGSSGGAAVAVAAGLVPFAPGSDGGGSIRIPAAVCGLVGFKPSRGLIPSGTGLDSLAGLSVPGPISRTVADAAMMLDALMNGGRYPLSVRSPDGDGTSMLSAAVRGEGRFQLGVMTSSPWDNDFDIALSAEATAALDLAVAALDDLGHGLEQISLEADASYAPNFRTVWQVGASTIEAEGVQLDLLEPVTRWLLLRGRERSGQELAAALVALVQCERSIIRQCAPFDAVLTPSLALTPRPIGWFDSADAERNFTQQVQYTPFSSFANVAGLPAITLPVSRTAQGIPMGVQLVGRPGGERALLAIATQLERRFVWQDLHPPQW